MVYLCLYGEVKFLWSRSSTEREVDALNSLFPFQIFSSLFRKTHSFPMCPFTPYPYWKIKMKLSLPFLSPLSLSPSLSLSLSLFLSLSPVKCHRQKATNFYEENSDHRAVFSLVLVLKYSTNLV